ncbi:MFS transporter [Phenylobacterium sp.]|jgi:predicted MFS family arabinose efflux permease|uniref:spinster family MFS transporter n=1 Tax=Phenylobacterium sp. TaxID=1871053 RepID=UPI002E31C6FC|nr:MFS transporter [Phenylobacterium sp.]HEX3367893.1 MFS transporter [Phenylobacterium sp.]
MTATSAGAAPATSPAAKPVYSENYKRLILFLLVTAYTLNFIDRTIIATLGQPIKDTLKITDTQLGLLGGLYFALLYTLLGIPIARLAERFSRVNIISAAIVIWSGFTALCGTASGFAVLAAYRFGVGIGEAGLSPPAHSLISDYYEPKKRASALSIYSFGIPLGTMIGAVAGGLIAKTFGWRVAFMVVGLPGVAVAIALRVLVKEPPRGHSEPEPVARAAGAEPFAGEELVPAAPAATSLRRELKEMGSVVGLLFGKWPILNMVLGITLVSFAGYGGGQFVPPYFLRTFHLDVAQVGLITGLVAGFSQGLGTLIGGPLTDRLSKLSPRWYALVPAIGVTLAYPAIVGIYTAPSWQVAAAFMLLPGLLSYVYLAPTFGVVQNMAPTHQRATAAAILLFFLNLIALGGGPPFTGWVIDHFAAFHYAHAGSGTIWDAINGFFGSHPADFQAACPGGKAAKTASDAAKAACSGALVLGTRHGILVAYAFGLWGAFHYLLGSFGLAKAMSKARADRGESD